MNCKSCGGALKAGAKFCSQCGAVVPPAAEAGLVGQTIRCPKCGTENPASAKFCRHDGYRFAAATESAGKQHEVPTSSAGPASPAAAPRPPDGLKCPSCGTVNPPGARFCRKDGVPLTAAGATPENRQPAAALAPPVPESPTRLEETPKPSRPSPAATRPTPVEHDSPRNWRPLVIGGGVLALLLAVGGAGYAYWRGLIGDRPGSIAREVTAELKEEGFTAATVTMGKDWIAFVSGSVVGQDKKQALERVIKNRPEIRGVNLDELKVQPSATEMMAAAQQTLTVSGLDHITVAIDANGIATLSGRAQNESEAENAGEAVSNIDGVTQVDNQIQMPFAVLERDINSALRAAGLGSARATVRSTEDISVSGTLKDELDRAKVVATIVQSAATVQETVDPSAVRDDMTVAAPVPVVAAVPRAERPSTTVQSGESTAQPTPPVAPVESEAPVIGTWAGAIRAGIVGSNVQLAISSASVGTVAGRADYYGSYRYCTGELTLVNAAPPKYVFEEKIVEKNPKATCPGGGKLKLELTGPSTASVNWVPTGRLIPLKYSGTVQKR